MTNFTIEEIKDCADTQKMLRDHGIIPFFTTYLEKRPSHGTINHAHKILADRQLTQDDLRHLKQLEKLRKDMLGWRVVRDILEHQG